MADRIEVDIEFVSNFQKLLKEASNEAHKMGDTIGDKVNHKLKETEGHASKIGEIFKAISLEKLAEKGVKMLKEGVKFMWESTVKWEQNKAIMKSFFQDTVEAEMKMRDLEEASHDAFEIDEMTKGFVNLKNAGLNPAKEELEKFADIAKSQGKSFEGFTGAVQHAMVGKYKALLEYGIKIKENNGKLETSFRGQKETIGATQAELEKYLLKIGEMPGIVGATDTAMNTLGGSITGIKQAFEGLAVAIGENLSGPDGIFTGFLKDTKNFITALKDLVKTEESELYNKQASNLEINAAGFLSAKSKEEKQSWLTDILKENPDLTKGLTDEQIFGKNTDEIEKRFEERTSELKNKKTGAQLDEAIKQKVDAIKQLQVGESETYNDTGYLTYGASTKDVNEILRKALIETVGKDKYAEGVKKYGSEEDYIKEMEDTHQFDNLNKKVVDKFGNTFQQFLDVLDKNNSEIDKYRKDIAGLKEGKPIGQKLLTGQYGKLVLILQNKVNILFFFMNGYGLFVHIE